MQRGDALTADMLDEFHSFVQEELAALLDQLPINYEMTINLKTAKSLGLDVHSQLQQLANEVIE
jgi:hypothetical protein